ADVRLRRRAHRVPAGAAQLACAPAANRVFPRWEPVMDAQDLQNALAALADAVRLTLRTELTSPWLPAQLGLLALAALASTLVGAIVRRRFDLVSATMGWPPTLRLVVRALIANFGVLVFIALIGLARIGIRAWVTHPRTYLLAMAVD